jgi:hypothetical protein
MVFPRAEVLNSQARGSEPESTEWTAAASIFYAGDWKQLPALVARWAPRGAGLTEVTRTAVRSISD